MALLDQDKFEFKLVMLCYFLPEVIVSLLTNFANVFSVPSWRNAQTFLIGSILCNGKRTVSSALRVMGLSQGANFQPNRNIQAKLEI